MSEGIDERRVTIQRLRSDCPVFRDEATKTFILTRMVDVRALLSDAGLWRDPDRAEEGALVKTFKPADMKRPGDRDCGIGWLDPPDHARVRGPIQLALARRVARLAPTVEAIVGARLDTLAGKESFDVLADFSMAIPISVIGHLFGVDTADLAQFRAWSEAALKIFDPAATAQERAATTAASEAICDYLDEAVVRGRLRPRDDLIGDLLAAQAAAEGPGAPLSDAEIRVNCMNLLLGGNVTTADLIANGAWLLLSHPGELEKLRVDPALIGPAIEEILRFEPPTQGTQRIASRDLQIEGCPIRTTQVVAVVIEAANRDPAAFPRPDVFDIARRDGAHVSFGGGAHICIGAALARLEARIAISALFERFPRLALVDPETPPRWRAHAPLTFRGLESLAVKP